MDIGKRISLLREQRGWTTNRLANNCGISQSFLRSVELGEKSISVDNLSLICNALNISLRDFFDVPAEHDTVDQTLQRQISSLSPSQKASLSSLLSSLMEE